MDELPTGGLVLYRRRPACVKQTGAARLEIEVEDGRRVRVRPKDVVLLHPGPCALRELAAPEPLEGVDAVRDLLHGEGGSDLTTLSELLYGAATPATVWACWQLLDEDLHFTGPVDAVAARSAAEVAALLARREAAQAEARAWEAFVGEVRAGRLTSAPDEFLRPLEDLALGRRAGSRLLKELGRAETPENAHAMLLQLGRWSVASVPHVARAGLPQSAPSVDVPAPSRDVRVDLTGMAAFAIDDEGSRDPDDAVSLDGDVLWVHVADVAAIVAPGSAADVEARARGATLYLPEGAVPMLPAGAVQHLGLGLDADGVGPALSFRLQLAPDGSVQEARIQPSLVRVERLTYEQAHDRLSGDPALGLLARLTERSRQRRLAAGAIDLQWPEVRLRVDLQGPEPDIRITPLAHADSRNLVAEAMILAGEGAARYAVAHAIPLPFSVQEAVDEEPDAAPASGRAADYALRRRQKPARVSGEAAWHRGLGLDAYARATSPLRRYQDLLVHQQLRAAVTGAGLIDARDLMERAAQAEQAAAAVRSTERLANRHWILVWLQQHPGWHGAGELLDVRGRRALLLLPDLALETWVPLPPGGEPGACYRVMVRSVDLPRLELHVELEPAA